MKVFIAVGTQLAFDRLIRAVDEWASTRDDVEVFAQTGPANYIPKHMQHQHFVAPSVFAEKSQGADLIIAHAGTGSIFTALELGKPLIVMPRLAKFKEHRNDHQLATVERFKATPGINVAADQHDLRRLLDNVDALTRPDREFQPYARPQLLRAVSDFVNSPAPRKRDRVLKFFRGLGR